MRYRLEDDAAVVLLFRQVLVHVTVVGGIVIALRATNFNVAQEVLVAERFSVGRGDFHAMAVARIIRDVHLGTAVFVRDGNLRAFHVFTGEDDAVACGDVEVGNAITAAVVVEQEGEGVCTLAAAQQVVAMCSDEGFRCVAAFDAVQAVVRLCLREQAGTVFAEVVEHGFAVEVKQAAEVGVLQFFAQQRVMLSAVVAVLLRNVVLLVVYALRSSRVVMLDDGFFRCTHVTAGRVGIDDFRGHAAVTDIGTDDTAVAVIQRGFRHGQVTDTPAQRLHVIRQMVIRVAILLRMFFPLV